MSNTDGEDTQRKTTEGARMKTTQIELDARAIIAGDLFREGKITRRECFRIEMDALLGEDTGKIKYEENQDYNKDQL